MSNVIKLKKKKPDIDEWKEQVETLSDKLADRIHDAIRLSDDEAIDAGIPEEIYDCTIVGVLVSVMVVLAEARDVIGPEALLKLVEYQIAMSCEKDDA